MAIPNKVTALVCGGLGACTVLIAGAAQAQRVSFAARRDFAAGTNPHSVAVGDFNRDGLPDLAVANFNSHDVSLLLGNGDGSFQAPRNFPAPTSPWSVAVGDFNGDGILVFAVTHS